MMDKAETKYGVTVSAETYNKASHGVVFCTDPICDVRLVFRSAGVTRGSVFPRRAHFATYANHQHAQNCQVYKECRRVQREDKKLNTAIDKGHIILLNLNIDEKPYVSAQFKKEAARSQKSTRYLQGQGYVSCSIKTVNAFYNLIKRIEAFDRLEAWDLIRINYRANPLMRLEDFILHHGSSRAMNGFLEMLEEKALAERSRDAWLQTGDRYSAADAYYLYFKPTAGTQRGQNKKIYGSSRVLQSRTGQQPLLLLHCLDVQNARLREAVLAQVRQGEALSVIAVPSISLPNVFNARVGFESGEKRDWPHTVFVNWQIKSAKQIASARSYNILPVRPVQRSFEFS